MASGVTPASSIRAFLATSTASAQTWSASFARFLIVLTTANYCSRRPIGLVAVPQTKNTVNMRMSDALRRAGDAAHATGQAFRSGGQASGQGNQADGALRAPDHRSTGRGQNWSRHALRDDRGERRRRRVRDRGAGGHDLLQHVRGPGPRPRGALPDHHDGAVRGARAVHRPMARPDTAGPQVRARGHHAHPRPALLRDVGERERLGDAAARRVRHPGAAEGGRRGQGLGHASPAARQPHACHRQRALRSYLDRHVHGGSGPRRRGAVRGRRRVDAARWHADLPGGHGARAPPSRADRRSGRGTHAGARARPGSRPWPRAPPGNTDAAGHAAAHAAAGGRRKSRTRAAGTTAGAGGPWPTSGPSSPRR